MIYRTMSRLRPFREMLEADETERRALDETMTEAVSKQSSAL